MDGPQSISRFGPSAGFIAFLMGILEEEALEAAKTASQNIIQLKDTASRNHASVRDVQDRLSNSEMQTHLGRAVQLINGTASETEAKCIG